MEEEDKEDRENLIQKQNSKVKTANLEEDTTPLDKNEVIDCVDWIG